MLIGLHGRKQAGKDTTYERIALHYPNVVRRAFADKLYASAAAALGISEEALRAMKTDSDATISVYANADNSDDPYATILVANISARWYLQLFGLEAHREVFGDDFWVEQLDLDHEGLIVCITDVRFPNEAKAIHAAGGAVVQIIGTPEVENNEDMHASEFPLPDEMIDYVIDNSARGVGAFDRLDESIAFVIDGLSA